MTGTGWTPLNVAFTNMEWQAAAAAIALLSQKPIRRAAYVTVQSIADVGSCSSDVARIALNKLWMAGVLKRRGLSPVMYSVPWTVRR